MEDHELIVQVESTMGSESKFLFRKNYAKYEFFKNPMVSLITSLFSPQREGWIAVTLLGLLRLKHLLKTKNQPTNRIPAKEILTDV